MKTKKMITLLLAAICVCAALAACGTVVLKERDESAYSIGGGEIAAADIENLFVDWGAGEVTITEHDGDGIAITETAQENENDRLRYKIAGNTLEILYCKPQIKATNENKSLTVSVPGNTRLKDVLLDATSATINLDGITCEKIKADVTSGNITVNAAFSEMGVDSTSGNCTVFLPEDTAGVSVRMDTVSGKLNNEIATLPQGDIKIRFDSTSGDLTIRKKQKKKAANAGRPFLAEGVPAASFLCSRIHIEFCVSVC